MTDWGVAGNPWQRRVHLHVSYRMHHLQQGKELQMTDWGVAGNPWPAQYNKYRLSLRPTQCVTLFLVAMLIGPRLGSCTPIIESWAGAMRGWS